MKHKNIEMKIYEWLGVNIFRKYVLFTWEKIANFLDIDIGYRIKDMSIGSLKKYKTLSKGFAISHAAVLTLFIVLAIIKHTTVIYWVVNMGLNLYCIMVQRYNHIRINHIIDIKQRIEKRKQEMVKYSFEQKENTKIIKPKMGVKGLSNSNTDNLDNISENIKKCEELIQQFTINNEENKDGFKVLKKTMVTKK